MTITELTPVQATDRTVRTAIDAATEGSPERPGGGNAPVALLPTTAEDAERVVAERLAAFTAATLAYGTARGHADAVRAAFLDAAPGSQARRAARAGHERAAEREACAHAAAEEARVALEAALGYWTDLLGARTAPAAGRAA